MMRTHKDAQPPELLEIAELRGEDRLPAEQAVASLVLDFLREAAAEIDVSAREEA
jgi:hypothetical protein